MKKKRLIDAYRFEGFRPIELIKGYFGDPTAFVVTLKRRSKKQFAALVAKSSKVITIVAPNSFVIFRAVDTACILRWKCAEWIASDVAK